MTRLTVRPIVVFANPSGYASRFELAMRQGDRNLSTAVAGADDKNIEVMTASIYIVIDVIDSADGAT